MRKADIYTAVIFILYSVVGFFYIIPTQIQYSIPPEEVSNAVFLPTFFPTSAVITFGLVSAMFLFGALNQFFDDGNKRTSRLMMNGVLLGAGEDAISVPGRRRLEFNQAMIRFYDSQDGTEMMRFMADCSLDPQLRADA